MEASSIQVLISPISYTWDVSCLLPLQRCMTYRKLCAEELEPHELKPGRSPFFESSYIKLANWNSGIF